MCEIVDGASFYIIRLIRSMKLFLLDDIPRTIFNCN